MSASRMADRPINSCADALLLSGQQSIQSGLPEALRPAALLTQEIDREEAAPRNRMNRRRRRKAVAAATAVQGGLRPQSDSLVLDDN